MQQSIIVLALSQYWQRLRAFRCAGSVLTDYRILKTQAAKLMKGKTEC